MPAQRSLPAIAMLAVLFTGCSESTGPSPSPVDELGIVGPGFRTGAVGGTIQLEAIAYDRKCDVDYCWYVQVSAAVRWRSTNPDVAEIGEHLAGYKLAKLLEAGSVRVIASAGSRADTIEVAVTP
jgi:hypothetical protein